MKAFMIFLVVLSLLAVTVSAEVKGPQVTASFVNQDPDPVDPDDTVELRFRIENKGAGSLDEIEIELVPKYPFTLTGSAVKKIGSLDAFQKGSDAVVVKYNVAVDKNSDEGNYDIFLRYRIGSQDWTRVGPFQVSVKSAEAILNVVSIGSPETISAGSITDLEIVLKNYGKSSLKDVRVSLDLNSIPFAPVENSNEKIINHIPAGETKTVKFKLVSDADANEAYYKSGLSLRYVDDSAKSHFRNSTIGLLVYNKPEYTLALKETQVFTPDSNGQVVFSISNTGPGEIRFMTAELLEDPAYKVLSPPIVYVGNLEADDFETLDFDIKTATIQPGKIDLKVKLTYKDSLNKEISDSRSVPHPLYSQKDAVSFGLVPSGQNFLAQALTFAIQIIFGAFIIFMLVDCWKNSLPKYKKVLWTILIFTGMGAILYYFIARRKR